MHLKRMMVNKPEPESEEENAELSKIKEFTKKKKGGYKL